MTTEIMPIVTATGNSMEVLAAQGLLGSISAICIGVALMCVWVLFRQAKACFEGTKTVVENNTKAIDEFKMSNRDALTGVQVALAELKGSIGK